mmetsp:Transcript_16691/g.28000  ORF Transcript_16691/g.28000 Transcript_16691/m.28000 type:complete len:952 (-) Transcript_16691:144-2999(-)
MRLYVLPRRNNANINNTAFQPLLPIAHGGNHDIKYIDSPYGSAEYAASYVGKPESADFKILSKIIAKRLRSTPPNTDRGRLRLVANALLNSSHVGTVQACYSLLNLDIVKSSVTVINVNPLHRRFISRNLIVDSDTLDVMHDDDTASTSGIGSQLGRRNAYSILCNQQRFTYNGVCHITFYILLTYYSLNNPTPTDRNRPSPPPLLLLATDGSIVDPPSKFVIDNISFALKRNQAVINLSPAPAYDPADERSCYATLLMHLPWPPGGESNLLGTFDSSIPALDYHLKHNNFPTYVMPALQRIADSETFLRTVPQPTHGLANENEGEEKQDSDSDSDCADIPPPDPVDEHTHLDSLLTSELLSDLQPTPGDILATNVSSNKYRKYRNFTAAALRQYMDNFAAENRIDAEDMYFLRQHNSLEFRRVSNHAQREEVLEQQLTSLTMHQREAYDKIVSHLTDESSPPLLMFLTGEGGTGKSRVIHLVTEFTHLHFGKQEGLHGAVLVCAPTGTSANNINGFTWHSVLGKGQSQSYTLSETAARRVGANLKGVQLFILDEISLVSCESLLEISKRFQTALCTTTTDPAQLAVIKSSPFGGIHVLLAGDFWQLKPVNGTPIYFSRPTSSKAKAGRDIWLQLNEYTELTQNCRFINGDMSFFATFLRSARSATLAHPPSDDDIDRINEACLLQSQRDIDNVDPKALWIANTNASVNKINRHRLSQLRQSGALAFCIVARHTPAKTLLSSPSEDIKQQLFRLYDKDYMTHINLAVGMPVMCNRNIATKIGLFNGATGTVTGFVFASIAPTELFPAVADFHTLGHREIPIVLVDVPSYRGPPLFRDAPTVVPFVEEASRNTFLQRNYHRWMLPLTPAAAITTHKAQSCTAHNGVVLEPTAPNRMPFARSLEYIQLSRSPSLELVSLLLPLRASLFTSHNDQRTHIANEYVRLRTLFSAND